MIGNSSRRRGSLGAKRRRIWFRELLPNLWAPIIVYVSLTLPLNIAAEAALSFLGVGLQAPTPSLGNILNNSVNYLDPIPHSSTFPGHAGVDVLSFNMLGDVCETRSTRSRCDNRPAGTRPAATRVPHSAAFEKEEDCMASIKKRTAVVALGVALALTAAACSSSKKGGSASASGGAGSSAVSATTGGTIY